MRMFLLLGELIALGVSGFALGAAELTVFAAASLSDALEDIAPLYRNATSHKVRFNFGASGLLARQIGEGAPADVFLSADEARLDQLATAGLILPDTRRVLLANQLVLVVGADVATPIAAIADLQRPEIRRLAIGEPATVPAGTYAKSYLEKNNLWSVLAPKMVPLDNVRAVLAAVEAGNADAGFVYRTDALTSRRVRIAIEVALNDGPRIVCIIAALKESDAPEVARAFVAFLAGAGAQAVFAKHGFLPPP